MDRNRCAFHYDYPYPHEDLDPGCQFTDETTFFGCGDKRYCRFHLPLADDDGQPTEKSTWQDAGPEGPGYAGFNAAVDGLIEAALAAEGPVNLSGVVFPGSVDFSERVFPEVLWYLARFLGYATFDKVEFKGAASFSDAEFKGDAFFRNAEFEGLTTFNDAEFKSIALFRDAEFKGIASFSDAEFKGGADFTNARFATTTQFQGTLFELPPEFHNVPLHPATRFNPGDGIAKQFPNIADNKAEQAYRTLKLHMSANQAHREEQFFFKREMQARARHEGWWRRILYAAYDAVADYGHSIARPMGWWLGLLGLMWVVHAAASREVIAAGYLAVLPSGKWLQALMAAASNTLPIGGLARQGLGQATAALYGGAIPTWLPILGMVHTVLSAVLIFLAVLALRNLFRMK